VAKGTLTHNACSGRRLVGDWHSCQHEPFIMDEWLEGLASSRRFTVIDVILEVRLHQVVTQVIDMSKEDGESERGNEG